MAGLQHIFTLMCSVAHYCAFNNWPTWDKLNLQETIWNWSRNNDGSGGTNSHLYVLRDVSILGIMNISWYGPSSFQVAGTVTTLLHHHLNETLNAVLNAILFQH